MAMAYFDKTFLRYLQLRVSSRFTHDSLLSCYYTAPYSLLIKKLSKELIYTKIKTFSFISLFI